MYGNKKEVILIPGLGWDYRKQIDFELLQESLDRNYKTRFFDYSSNARLDDTVIGLESFIIRGNSKNPLFFTHSFGSIILRMALANSKLKSPRVVETAPINKESRVLNALIKYKQTKNYLGNLAEEFFNRKNEILSLPFNAEVGIIAGNKRIDLRQLQSWIIPFILDNRDSDGKVFVDETRLETEKDFLILPLYHSYLIKDKKVFHYVRNFFENGYFKSPSENS
jgi:hypothetical protein